MIKLKIGTYVIACTVIPQCVRAGMPETTWRIGSDARPAQAGFQGTHAANDALAGRRGVAPELALVNFLGFR